MKEIQSSSLPQQHTRSQEYDRDQRRRFIDVIDDDDTDEEDNKQLEGPVTAPFQQSVGVGGSVEKTSLSPAKVVTQIANELIDPLKSSVEKGITQSEIIIKTAHFDDLQIIIDHYDTAPHSFNIFINGNAKAQRFIMEYQNQLQTALKKALPTYQCTLFAPSYPKEDRKRREVKKKTLEKSEDFSYVAKKEPR